MRQLVKKTVKDSILHCAQQNKTIAFSNRQEGLVWRSVMHAQNSKFNYKNSLYHLVSYVGFCCELSCHGLMHEMAIQVYTPCTSQLQQNTLFYILQYVRKLQACSCIHLATCDKASEAPTRKWWCILHFQSPLLIYNNRATLPVPGSLTVTTRQCVPQYTSTKGTNWINRNKLNKQELLYYVNWNWPEQQQ